MNFLKIKVCKEFKNIKYSIQNIKKNVKNLKELLKYNAYSNFLPQNQLCLINGSNGINQTNINYFSGLNEGKEVLIRDIINNKRSEMSDLYEEEKKIWDKKGNFENFNLSEETIKNLKSLNFEYLLPIQQKTFEKIFNKEDIIGKDRTGSGKTLAYSLPIIEKLRMEKKFKKRNGQNPLVLILVPTRELCIQVTKEVVNLQNFVNEFNVLSIYGGVSIEKQIEELEKGVDIVIGTPGRLIDLQNRENLKNNSFEKIILDETDQMLNIGFNKDIELIINNIIKDNSNELQYLLFSATIPQWVKEFSSKFLSKNYNFIDLVDENSIKTSKQVDHYSFLCNNYSKKISSIKDILLVYGGKHSKSIIFTETKREADDIFLKSNLGVNSDVLHGDVSQNKREKVFDHFRKGKINCLIATNVAARGLDIPKIDLIIQMSPPMDIDSYIHRSGRTARAGKTGICITFYSNDQLENLKKIEDKTQIKFNNIGFPQPIDIIKANFDDTLISLNNVSNKNSDLFKEFSQKLIKDYGAEYILSKALVLISGYNELIKPKSLLTISEFEKTYIFKSDFSFVSMDELWELLKENFSLNFINSIKELTYLKDKEGIIFDIDYKFINEIENYINDDKIENKFDVIVPSTLPELEIKERRNNRGDIKLVLDNLDIYTNNRDIEQLFKSSKIRFRNLKLYSRDDKKFGLINIEKNDLNNALKLNGKSIKKKIILVRAKKMN